MPTETNEGTEGQTGSPHFWKIAAHEGHPVVVATYGTQDEALNATVECLACYEVITDADRFPEAPVDTNPDLG